MSNNAQQQEPVYFCDYGYEGWGKVDADMAAANIADGMTVEAYYTSPPAQRTWVGLTDEEIDEWTPEIHSVIRAIEAKLKEKNT